MTITIKILVISLFIGLYGCGPNMVKPDDIKYKIENKSNYPIKIIPVGRQGELEHKYTLTIKPNSVLEGKKKGTLPPSSLGLLDAIYFDKRALAKVLVIFDDKKKIEYKPCGDKPCADKQNFFDIQYNSSNDITYTFTEADYNAATDCNGRCE